MMRISDVFMQSGGVDKIRKATGVHKAENKDSVSAKPKDSVSLSPEAQKMAEAGDAKMVAAHAEASPEVRQERIDAVKSRVESGYYNTSEFADAFADRLIKEMEL
jgi:flagellar biosynthesis anti-sigma factor FlgM